ncbi:bifunctional hydroxymethylpyrimidine kinase/phosphomethylpyrimidine kinase [Echinicola sp. CAU 1574]|uniref:hydroxymethylpyrimidine kinase n=1 Tax=Echinicola arenosa TaxID=2774144 RepID=A0ABR9AQZ7_9BACT|nr:bifunctional hydroxymethylpyrimidine kinase/phosphomethylpyrimidine kinase [Echinicola arenosa]MBD8490293.1 bifunctional hydroxymethylpyrimidine kinase/phosphomethylpyrimidine kinase [Echinicola arenosa]
MNHQNKEYVPVLTIAGSDSGGGAGIQADIKTMSALGCFATSVITATTAQNTLGVCDIHDIPVAHIVLQLQSILTDITPNAIKIGMLSRPEVVMAIAKELKKYPEIPIVFDPVMVATSGDRLIQQETVEVIKSELFPLTHILTPNLDEASVILGREILVKDELEQAAEEILKLGPEYVLVKGGHLDGDVVRDVLVAEKSCETFESTKLTTKNVHGTGCTLSSAIASFLGRGLTVQESVKQAREYVYSAIEAGMEVKTGQGNGPLNHFYEPIRMIKHEMVR